MQVPLKDLIKQNKKLVNKAVRAPHPPTSWLLPGSFLFSSHVLVGLQIRELDRERGRMEKEEKKLVRGATGLPRSQRGHTNPTLSPFSSHILPLLRSPAVRACVRVAAGRRH